MHYLFINDERFINDVTTKLMISPQIYNVKYVDETLRNITLSAIM